MSSVVLAAGVVPEIRRHAEEEYPFECCGFLLGGDGAAGQGLGGRRIHRTVRAANVAETDRRRRYVISPQDLLRIERALESTSELVVGFYHSHPEHPAEPSEFDRDHAWPWYSYLVLAVNQGRGGELGAFTFEEEQRQFLRVPWTIEEPADGPHVLRP